MSMSHPKWDPSVYQRFRRERLEPGFTLMDKVGALPVGDIADLGCGTGDHAAALAERHPGRKVYAVDRSPEMLAKASTFASLTVVPADIARWQAPTPLALLFSNAALQWVDGHATLIPALAAQVVAGGTLALQFPTNLDTPARTLARDLAEEMGLSTEGLLSDDILLGEEGYYDALVGAGMVEIEIWTTTYWHVIREGGVTAWVEGTALRPLLSHLDEAGTADFLARYRRKVDRLYGKRADGSVLYPMDRLFMVARRAG